MIRLLQTQVKEVHLIFEIPFSELEKIKIALDHSEFDLKDTDNEEKEAINYLTKVFHPFIVEITKSMKGKDNDSH
jgi:hypothetical protein